MSDECGFQEKRESVRKGSTMLNESSEESLGNHTLGVVLYVFPFHRYNEIVEKCKVKLEEKLQANQIQALDRNCTTVAF